MKNISLPQTTGSNKWNISVNQINTESMAAYGKIDRLLDTVEAQKTMIADSFAKLDVEKDHTKVWMGFLNDLLSSWSGV